MGVRTTVMARPLLALLFMTGLLTTTFAIQFTPNSGCASLCMDSSSKNASDPSASATLGSDIVCTVDDYNSTAVGLRFEQCLNCLQNSSASTSTQNDIMWYLYNLRYAFDTCVFGMENASVPMTTPCSTDTVCGPLQMALESEMDTPSISTEFSYCSANQVSFLGTYLGTCSDCLRESAETLYLANFLVALHAGCAQQPPTGVLIGLDSSVFNLNPVNITAPIIAPSTSPQKRLSQFAVIGIAVGGGVLLVILAAIMFVWSRKRMARKRNARLQSRLDGRFGSKAITVPVHGAYIEPAVTKLSPPPLPHENFSLKRLPPTVALQMPPVPELPRAYSPRRPEEYYYAAAQASYKQPNPPTHQEDVSREFGFKTASNSQEPSPYSPPSSDQSSHQDSPVSAVSHNSTSPFAHKISPASVARSNTPHSGNTGSTSISRPRTSPKTSPENAPGLPRAPSRNESIRTVASVQGRSGQHEGRQEGRRDGRPKRDLSASRGDGERRAPSRAENQISGPMVAVTSRYEEEIELQRRRERENLWKQGILSPAAEGREREGSSSEGEEMWPGNY